MRRPSSSSPTRPPIPDAELHASLIEGFFPKRAEVIEVGDLAALLG